MTGKRPAMLFYGGDWMKDPALRAVSLAARGLWIDLLCLMWESPERGVLRHGNGHAVTVEQVARMVGAPAKDVERLLDELEECGVFSRVETDGAIYSRRMVRDEGAAEGNRERVARHRMKRGSNGEGNVDVMPKTRGGNGKVTIAGTSSSSCTGTSSVTGRDKGGTPSTSVRRDPAHPVSDIGDEDWKRACACADRIEQADVVGDAVVGIDEEARAVAFALLADWLRDRGRGGWQEIEAAVGAIASEPARRADLAALQRYPDGAYPRTNGSDRAAPSRIERVIRSLARHTMLHGGGTPCV